MTEAIKNDEVVEICKAAVETWGNSFQEDMCLEECNELIHAILKSRRGQATQQDIIEEIADVQIMLVQMRIMLDNETLFREMFNFKLNRLKNKLNLQPKPLLPDKLY